MRESLAALANAVGVLSIIIIVLWLLWRTNTDGSLALLSGEGGFPC